MMKIILSLLFVLLSVPAFAQGIYLPVASGTVTQANMKISAVDGTSFIDFTAADVLTGKTGNLLVVRDSSGRAIQGFIKAAGTGETFSDALAGWNFTSGWINHLNATINDANTFTTTASGGIRANDFLTELACYRVNFTANVSAGSVRLVGFSISLATGAGSGLIVPQPVVNFYNTTAPSFTCYHLRNSDAAITDVTSLKAEQVLTPSTTGVTITSTKGGTTFNWAQKNASFNYNDSSGYTYQIYKVLDAPVVDSDACTNANATINLTAGSAAWSCTGIDDAAYQDGKHIIAVYDAAGVAAFGYYKASGSGAVVNAKSGSTQNWISIGAGFSTAGNYTRKVLYVGD